MDNKLLKLFFAALVALLSLHALPASSIALPPSKRGAAHTAAAPVVAPVAPAADGHWVSVFTTMPQLTEPQNLPPAPFNQTGRVFADSTIRQTVRVTQGGAQLRFRFSNAFGVTELPITAVTVARAPGGSGSSQIDTATLRTLTFSGSESFVVPNGALVVSDVVDFEVDPLDVLSITMYLQDGQESNMITGHPGSRTTSFFSQGNHVSDEDLGWGAQSVEHWYFIDVIEAWEPMDFGSLIIIGDSITDGRGSINNENNRWPDLLNERILRNPSTAHIAIGNQAAGGNRVLRDGLGPNALSRIDRDVLAQSAVQYVLIFEGVNDIGGEEASESAQTAVGDRLVAALDQIAARVRAQGIPIFAATITPFGDAAASSGYTAPSRERTRGRVNEWIRSSGVFDAVVDFDAMLRDPDNPQRLRQQFNSGDNLHPSVAGYQQIADEFPLDIFEQFAGGVSGLKGLGMQM
ncbi:extracellular GDSL-like lipase/acylhydrolase [Lineolata rhizophorae]|uniref:Extracellular GDSL-like lipase/acylhydrolase n=1 Tax=Lineolata rhizophorae TaxID=578093 RepID=A0A6A6NNY4_9PEZI|nr:extracellular GDSL-like lipase/acylhydrolase [Lineolata rhizophorae]